MNKKKDIGCNGRYISIAIGIKACKKRKTNGVLFRLSN